MLWKYKKCNECIYYKEEKETAWGQIIGRCYCYPPESKTKDFHEKSHYLIVRNKYKNVRYKMPDEVVDYCHDACSKFEADPTVNTVALRAN